MSPNNWPWLELEQVAQVTAGNPAPQGDEYFLEGKRPFVRVQDLGRLNGASHLRETVDLVNDKASATLRLFPKGSVLFTKSGASLLLNQRAILGADMHVVSHIGVAVPGPRISSEWLYYWLRTVDFADISHGANMPSLPLSRVKKISIPVPSLDEQRVRIAEIEKQFSRLDEAVANLQRAKANLKRYKAAVLKAAVEGRLVETEAELARREGRSYETGDRLVQRICEERRAKWTGKGKYKEPIPPATNSLPKLPEGWSWATMPQLGELDRGKSKHRPRNDDALYGGPYPFIQTGDVRRSDGSITEYTQTYSEFGLSQSRLWPVGTLCITIAANIAETGILQLEACFPDSVVGFIPSVGSSIAEYVEYFIRTAREGLDRFASSTAQKNINLEILRAVAIPTPPLAEQRRIVAEVARQLSIVREVEAQVDVNLKRADASRQAILAKAFGQSSIHVDSNELGAGTNSMEKRKLPVLPAARKSDAEDHRVDLLNVLQQHKEGIRAEQLFQEAGYRGDQIDTFYRDLALIADQLNQFLPDGDGKTWPDSGAVLIQLKA